MDAAVTQLVECPAVNRLVTGSSPVGGVTLSFTLLKQWNGEAVQKKEPVLRKKRFVLKEASQNVLTVKNLH